MLNFLEAVLGSIHPAIPQRLFEYFWGLLPDECQVQGCKRHGVRGNENIIDGVVMCDYCDAARTRELHTEG